MALISLPSCPVSSLVVFVHLVFVGGIVPFPVFWEHGQCSEWLAESFMSVVCVEKAGTDSFLPPLPACVSGLPAFGHFIDQWQVGMKFSSLHS
jgi:hypothetical protein